MMRSPVVLPGFSAVTLACGSSTEAASVAPSFRFTLNLPSRPPVTVDGDSAYWQIVSFFGPPLFEGHMTSPDAVAPNPPPTTLVFLIPSPVLDSSGFLAPGTYSLVPAGTSGPSFLVLFPEPGSTDIETVSDSGTVVIQPTTVDSVVVGAVNAWVHQWSPIGPPYRIAGNFQLRYRQ